MFVVAISFYSCNKNKKKDLSIKNPISSKFALEILDDEALKIIDKNVSIQIEASGFTWTEGPLWVEDGNYFIFSDIPENKIYKLNSKKETSTYLMPSGYTNEKRLEKEPGSNGLLLSEKGELILMQQGDRRIAKMNSSLNNPKPNYTTLVDSYQGKKLNSPNDGVIDANGNLYFTDPPYGLPLGENDPGRELDFQGVYCLLNSGELLLLDKLTKPNGITISPDEKKLYVAVSDKLHAVWYAYDIISPGKVENKSIFKDVTELVGKPGNQGLPDGMKMNKKGYLFATGPGGIWVFNNQGKTLARLYTGQHTSNCGLTSDEKKLFITADDYILSVDLK